ncbi:17553_t:CDS:2, partial [Cetraspora pellucida]
MSNLNGTSTMISQLMEAAMSRSLWCTFTSCFNSRKTRKLSIIITLVVVWQYVAILADLYLHATAIGNSQQLPGPTVPSTRSLEIATNCSEISYLNNCASQIKNPRKTLTVYQNTSDTLQIRSNEEGIYLLQSPPSEKAYSYSGSGVFLRPSCVPISSICNLKARYGAMTNYSCPGTLWYASGNTVTKRFDVNVTSAINSQGKYVASNPMHAIITARFSKVSTNYDSEFVTEVHGDLSILLHCQILASKIDYVITLGSLKVSSQGNLTNSQLFTLGAASMNYNMAVRSIIDVEVIAYKGNSTLLANSFAQQWARATVSAFSPIIQENSTGGGYSYAIEVNKDQTIVPLSAVSIYAIIVILPLLIFSYICAYSLFNRHTNWILAEFICIPQRLIYQALVNEHNMNDGCSEILAAQANRMQKIECSVELIDMNLRSPIFQGIILGWAVSIIIILLMLAAGTQGQRKDFNVIWDLRVGLFLTAVTVITRTTSFVAGLMVPAILSGILAINKISNLNGSGKTISQLMEASMSHSLLCTLKSCFNSGQTRKLAIAIALVFTWQYLATIADLYLHTTAIGHSQQMPGTSVSSTRSLDIETNCSDTSLINNCVARLRGMKNPDKAFDVYYNTSDSLKVWHTNDGVYLLQSPPSEQTYAYSGSAVFLRPFCKPISSVCNLRSINSTVTSYNCPKTLWSASGSLLNVNSTKPTDIGVNVTNRNLVLRQSYIASNPIEAIAFARYVKDYSTNYDSEFVSELNGNITILLHCQLLSSVVDYVVTLGSLKASPQRNLTNSQLFNLGVASTQYEVIRIAQRDIEIVTYKGNSTLFSDAFAQQWAHATISAFSVMVQGNGTASGYSYTFEEDKDQSIVPLSATLVYAFVITFPLLIFSCICLFSLRNTPISWTLAEFLCAPQRLFYQLLIGTHHVNDGCLNNLTEQTERIKNIECSITEDGHFEL